MAELDVIDTQIEDVDGLEDRLLAMDAIVELLKLPATKSQLEGLMNQYIILEDAILNGLQSLALVAETSMVQQQISDCVEKFNQLGCDYQESWTEDYWTLYESIREGYQKVKFTKVEKGKFAIDSTKANTEVQELSFNFGKNNLGLSSEGKKVLLEIDELSKQHISSTLAMSEHDVIERKCCNKCILF